MCVFKIAQKLLKICCRGGVTPLHDIKNYHKKEEFIMEYRFRPQGVCSQEMIVDVEDGIIKKAKIIRL